MFLNKKAIFGFIAASFLLVVSATALLADTPVKKDQPNKHQAASDKPELQNTGTLPMPSLLTHCQNNLRNCRDQVAALQTQVASLEQQNETLRQERNDFRDQVAELQPKAALPLCSNRSQWIHPTIPTVQCSPFSCDSQPFSCHRTCNENLDCADGFVCTSSGYCRSRD
ncbi:MAG: hypothetical protein ACREPB_16495 [Arenimonas sp.]